MLSINNPDKAVEEEGVWTPFGGSKFKVASSTNMKFQKLFARLQLPYHKKIDKGSLDPKIGLGIMCESLAATVLLDWEDVLGEDGEPVAYTPELGQKILQNHSDLRQHIQDFAADIENYRIADREVLGKS